VDVFGQQAVILGYTGLWAEDPNKMYAIVADCCSNNRKLCLCHKSKESNEKIALIRTADIWEGTNGSI